MTNHTTDKTTAQKLAEAGVSVESEYAWGKIIGVEEDKMGRRVSFDEIIAPAYLLSELLEMLPEFVEYKGDNYNLYLRKENNHYGVIYHHSYLPYLVSQWDKNPANAVAKILIWLIENNHIDPNNLES